MSSCCILYEYQLTMALPLHISHAFSFQRLAVDAAALKVLQCQNCHRAQMLPRKMEEVAIPSMCERQHQTLRKQYVKGTFGFWMEIWQKFGMLRQEDIEKTNTYF